MRYLLDLLTDAIRIVFKYKNSEDNHPLILRKSFSLFVSRIFVCAVTKLAKVWNDNRFYALFPVCFSCVRNRFFFRFLRDMLARASEGKKAKNLLIYSL